MFTVSTKVSNLKFILRRLLKIDIGEDFDLIIRANVMSPVFEGPCLF